MPDSETKERSANLARGNASLRREIQAVYQTVLEGFEHQAERAKETNDNWACYNCELGPHQQYSGRNRLYAPFVFEAVKARQTRVINDLFPQSSRHVEVISQDGTLPRAALSTCEHYIREIGLRATIAALFLNGEMEGQYNLYTSWRTSAREVTYRAKQPVELDGLPAGEVDDVLTKTQSLGMPNVEVLSDSDVLIFPSTAASLTDALSTGGGAAIIRRWTKRQIKGMIADGVIDKQEGEKLISELSSSSYGDYKDTTNEKLHAAGIKRDSQGTWVLVYEIWTELEIDGEYKLCQLFMAGKFKTLTARRNPYWCDKCPLISVPLEAISGVVKGRTPVSTVRPLQYYSNDVLNQGADSATYSLLPVIFRDPAYQTSPIILAPAAIIDIPPNGVQFAELPPLWQFTMQVLNSVKAEIFQTLSINPSMITQSEAKKPSQAEVAQQQQVGILTADDHAALLGRNVLDPLITFMMELDYQYRQDELFVQSFGEMGMQSILEKVPPFELNTRYTYKWIGEEATRSAQQMQEKIAALNIIKAIPPQMYPGYQLDLQPFVLDLTESVFGPRLGRLVLKDLRSQMSVDPAIEDQLLQLGHYVPVHPMDDIEQHMRVHRQSLEMDGDPFQTKAIHIQEHEMAFMQQQAAQQAAVMGAAGPEAGGQGGPGGPVPGAQPQAPTGAQRPPGAIHPDVINDPSLMPRDAYPQ